MHCSAVKYFSMQCSLLQRNAVQCNTGQFRFHPPPRIKLFRFRFEQRPDLNGMGGPVLIFIPVIKNVRRGGGDRGGGGNEGIVSRFIKNDIKIDFPKNMNLSRQVVVW